MTKRLVGRRILVAEDEYFIAVELVEALTVAGAVIVGPAGSVAEALQLVRDEGPIDGGILDVNLRGEDGLLIADALFDRNIPFVFATGHEPAMMPARFREIDHFTKPLDTRLILERLRGAMAS